MILIEKSSGCRVKVLKTLFYYRNDLTFYQVEYVDTGEQFLISFSDLRKYFDKELPKWTTKEKLKLYSSLFRGREDVFAKSYFNDNGQIQYYPSYNYGWRQLQPEKRTCQPLTLQVLKSHLKGETSLGIFPISKQDTCWFLVIDLDEADFREATLALWEVAEQYGVIPAVEISRSGQGIHIWFFFAEELPCRDARNFGKRLLELTLLASDRLSFLSFDRLFPNQDVLPKGGFGNLIALPLQGKSYQENKTIFVDKNFRPYPNQWDYLSQVKKLTYEDLAKVIYANFPAETFSGTFSVTLSNQLSFEKNELTPSVKYQLQKLASFSNPEFYLKQALRQPTYQISERLCLFEETDYELRLPRGLLSDIQKRFDVNINDKRLSRETINVTFNGQLSIGQEFALHDLLSHDSGILQAETGFGKTVLAASLIGHRQRRTLILVHNTQLLGQWLRQLEVFLEFEEEKAVRYTPTGREKVIGHVGQFGSNKKWRSKLVDVVMIQSLFKQKDLTNLVNDYDMMIVDECHHVSALQFEKVVAQFSGKYLYGLTATPERKNGHEPIVFQRIGPIIHKAEKRQVDFEKYLQLHFTNFGKFETAIQLSTNFIELNDTILQDSDRNEQIIVAIVLAYQAGRKVLVLVNRVKHMEVLYRLLKEKSLENVWTISGKNSKCNREQLLDEMSSLEDFRAFVLISTGKYIGEGFDLPQLDTVVLAAPLSWKNNLIQYAGRIHRSYKGKTEVCIIDFVDIHVPYLEKMFHRRQVAYKKMDYCINQKNHEQTIFDVVKYRKVFEEEVKKARQVLVRINWISSAIVEQLTLLAENSEVILVLPKATPMDLLNESTIHQFSVVLTEKVISETIVIINQSVVWYGSSLFRDNYQNLDGFILRLASRKLVTEFLDKIGEFSAEM